MPPSSSRNPAAEARPRLLVLTPSADLYGSDRALLLALPVLVGMADITIVSASDGQMAAEARDLGANVVVTPDWALRRRGLRLVAIPGTVVGVVRSLVIVRRLHRAERFAGIYANTVANAMLPFIKLVARVPVIVHVREVPRDRSRLTRVLFAAVDRVADRVVCNSAFTAELVTSIRPSLADRTRVVPDGIEPLPPVDRVDDGVLDIVCVGRIHPKKGQGVLIEAARRGVALGHVWRLHFFGDALPEHGGLEAELRRAVIEAGLDGVVQWRGYERDTRSLYVGMDVAVVPSVMPEEFSLVTAEAQMVGLPVVATGPGGPSDILIDGETGRIVAARDPDAIVGALVELEDAEIRTRWGDAGRARTLERFTIERYAPAVAREIAEAIGLADPRDPAERNP